MSKRFWIASISDVEGPAATTFRRLVMEERVFALLPSLRAAAEIAPGDLICFYLKGQGIAGYARAGSYPANKRDTRIPQPEKYRSVFELRDPIECKRPSFNFQDAAKRESLDAIRERDIRAGPGSCEPRMRSQSTTSDY